MYAILAALLKQLPALVLCSALLTAVVVLGYTGHIDATQTFGIILALVGIMGLTGFAVLIVQSIPNATLIGHGLFALELIAAVVVLTLHSTFTSAQTVPYFYLIVTGAATGAGGNAFAGLLTRRATGAGGNARADAETVTIPAAPSQ